MRVGTFVEAPLKVIVVDDDTDFRDSMRALLGSMGLAAECYASGAAYLDAFRADDAGCLILDLKLADLDGFALLDALTTLPGAPPVIVMTGYADPPSVVRAFRYRIVDFLQKGSCSEASLWDGIQQSFARDAKRRAVKARRSEARDRLARLKPGEREVLDLIIEGKDHASIATSLKIGRRAVENRMARVREKLDAQTLPQLIRLMADADAFDGEPESLTHRRSRCVPKSVG